MNKDEKRYDKRVRWQETRIRQMSYVNYLILTLSLAVLGFAISPLFEKGVSPSILCKLALISLAASMILGIFCAVCRLEDFRKTARITKLKCHNDRKVQNNSEIKDLRVCTKSLGKWSWVFLRFQIFLFFFGFVLLMLAIVSLWR